MHGSFEVVLEGRRWIHQNRDFVVLVFFMNFHPISLSSSLFSGMGGFRFFFS